MKNNNTGFPSHDRFGKRGFTLVEVIITITLAGVVATLLYSSFNGISYSAGMNVGGNLAQSQGLQKVMENIRSDFNYTSSLTTLNTLKANIGTGGQNNNYGSYTVVNNIFGDFVGGAWADGGGANNRLKVTIKNANGENLTMIFSPQNIQ